MQEIQPSDAEQSPEEKIAMRASFDALYELLRELGGLQGSQKFYTHGELRVIIERVRHGHREPSFVTNAFGLRNKMMELLVNDLVYKKHVHER